MTATSSVVYNSHATGYGAMIQTPMRTFSDLIPWTSGVAFKARMLKFPNTAHMIALAGDKGSCSISSSGSIAYKMDPMDEEKLQKGIEKMLHIAAAAGGIEIGTRHCKGDRLNVKTASSYEYEKIVKKVNYRGLRDFKTPTCSAHQMGSCRLGATPKTSAVNTSGEVEDLYVAEASVFPTALGVNPMVTAQTISCCTAQMVIENLRRKMRKNVNEKSKNWKENGNKRKGVYV